MYKYQIRYYPSEKSYDVKEKRMWDVQLAKVALELPDLLKNAGSDIEKRVLSTEERVKEDVQGRDDRLELAFEKTKDLSVRTII